MKWQPQIITCAFLFSVLSSACGGSGGDATSDGGTSSPCEAIDCSGHGECQSSPALECICDSGYHAESLSCVADGETGPCFGVDCSDHGLCAVNGETASCVCDMGYEDVALECVPSACVDVDCSGAGQCEVIADEPVCSCDDGYVANGLACELDCDPLINGTLTHDLSTVNLQSNITLNGGPLGYSASLKLEAVGGDDTIAVTLDANGTLRAIQGGPGIPIAPGNYKVYYSQANGGGFDTNPWNRGLFFGCWGIDE